MSSRRGSVLGGLNSRRGDVLGGVLAGVVSLPVALSMGTLSGLGPTAGVFGAVAFGVVAAVFGGTRGLVYGPNSSVAFAVSVVVAGSDNRLATAVVAVVLAGVIQVLLGSLRVGHLLSYTPYSVISGLLSGIGVLIVVSQIAPMLGASSEIGGLRATAGSWPDAFAHIDWSALAVGSVTFAVAAAWPSRLSTWVPSTAPAMVAGTLLGVLWLDGAPTLGGVSVGVLDLSWPDFSGAELVRLVPGAATIAALGSIDALIAAQVSDALTGSAHRPDREVVAQGLGNIGAGVVGGVPGGATIGMYVNIEAGGRSPLAGVLCAGTLLTLVVGLEGLVEAMPEAVLAGILIKIGLDIIDWRPLTRLARGQREHSFVIVSTLAVTVFYDLVTALVVGLMAGAVVLARRFEQLELDSVISTPLLDRTFTDAGPLEGDADEFSARVGLVVLRGSFTAASAARMIKTLSADIKDHEIVIVDMSQTDYMDDSAGMVAQRLIKFAGAHDTDCIIVGLRGQPHQCLSALGVLQLVPEGCVVEKMSDARRTAWNRLKP